MSLGYISRNRIEKLVTEHGLPKMPEGIALAKRIASVKKVIQRTRVIMTLFVTKDFVAKSNSLL